MRELDPFDASVLNVLARVPPGQDDLRNQLVGRLTSKEGKAIARVMLALKGADDDNTVRVSVRASKDAHATAASLLKQAAGVGLV